jgi:hypothetical protein
MFFTTFSALKFRSPFVISIFPLSLSPFFLLFYDIFILLHGFFFSVLPPPFPSLHPALFFSNLPAHFLQCWNFAWQAHQPCGRISWQVRIKGKSDLVTSPEWFSVILRVLLSTGKKLRNYLIHFSIILTNIHEDFRTKCL